MATYFEILFPQQSIVVIAVQAVLGLRYSEKTLNSRHSWKPQPSGADRFPKYQSRDDIFRYSFFLNTHALKLFSRKNFLSP